MNKVVLLWQKKRSLGQSRLCECETVHDNIAAGKCGEPATRDEVIEAAKISNAHEFVSKMPNGYDSEVGVGGGPSSQQPVQSQPRAADWRHLLQV